jgi:hypothetical protein
MERLKASRLLTFTQEKIISIANIRVQIAADNSRPLGGRKP